MGNPDGQIAVVTGSGRGIGRAIALRFAREGATVIVSSRMQSELDAVHGRPDSSAGAGRWRFKDHGQLYLSGLDHTSMVDFDLMAQYKGITSTEPRASAEGTSSQNCILEPDDIAALALFLATADSARITGQIISADGGYRL